MSAALTGCTNKESAQTSEGFKPEPPGKSVEKSAEITPSGTRVVMLGTGTPNAEPDRSGPAVAIVVGEKAYIIDAGPGVVRRANAASQKGFAALSAEKLGIVFLTHLHSDHTLGLPDLALTPWVLERDGPLEVWGPPGTEAMAEGILATWKEDVAVRTSGLEPGTENAEILKAHEIAPGPVFKDDNVNVTAFAVHHGEWKHAYAYRFETRDKTIVISGDTKPDRAIVEACDGCDVLVHEVYSEARFSARRTDWQKYHRASHTSTVELAAIAKDAKPKLLVLYHLLAWGSTDDEIIGEIRAAGYEGSVAVAHDLDVF